MQTSGTFPQLNLVQSPRKASAAGRQKVVGTVAGVTSRSTAARSIGARRKLARARAHAGQEQDRG